MFNANLQNFSLQVTYICGLETNGKLSPEAAYNKIRELWKQLKQSKEQLGIDKSLLGEERELNF